VKLDVPTLESRHDETPFSEPRCMSIAKQLQLDMLAIGVQTKQVAIELKYRRVRTSKESAFYNTY